MTAPPGLPATLTGAAAAYAADSKAPNTRRAYNAAWRAWEGWAGAQGLSAMPAHPAAVGVHLAALADTGAKLATVRMRLAAITAAHRLTGAALDTKAPAIAAVMAGIARRLGSRPRKVRALTVGNLAAMVADASERDRALLLLGFGAALRRSELVALDLADITIEAEGVLVTLRRSKGDQTGAGSVVAVRGSEGCLDPVAALCAWLTARGAAPGPLFPGRHGARLHDCAVARAVKAGALRAGLDPAVVSGHSLRRGLLTAAAHRGADLTRLRQHGRHRRLETTLGYVEEGERWRNNVTEGLMAVSEAGE